MAMMKKLKIVFVVLCMLSLSLFYANNAYADYAVPGCKEAYKAIGQAGQLANMETLVKTDCAIMHRKKWRLPTEGGTSNRSVCVPAWNDIVKAGEIENAKFMVTHNCPVFYRKGWVK
ncbi:MAG: hypothetical protein AB4352_14075 [Hormoscilla sp.]